MGSPGRCVVGKRAIALQSAGSADVFEANPHFNEQLSRLVRKYRSQGRSVRLFNGTAFSVGGGPVAFGVDPANTISSSLVRTKHVRGKTAWLSNYSISVPSVDAIKYIRSLQGYNRVVLKVDVEGYEFELLRALLASGALRLCAGSRQRITCGQTPARVGALPTCTRRRKRSG